MSIGKTIAKTETLVATVLFLISLASGSSKTTLRIKVLDSETRSVSLNANGVPTDCDQVTFDAYCRATSRTAELVTTLLVQDGDGDTPPFRITCTIESRFSRCSPLPIGESFDARKEKHGIAIFYEDDKGKVRKQLYSLVASGTNPPAATSVVAAQPARTAPQTMPTAKVSPAPAASAPAPAAPPAPAVSAPTASVPDAHATHEATEKVQCSFTSSPSGADILFDGKYVGSTPSEIEVTSGTHMVVFSIPGFAQWQRDLTVTTGSKLTVNAILQKQ